MGQTVTISTSDVPASYCPPSFAAAWAFGVSLLSAELAGNNFSFNYGPTTPAPDDQGKPWLRTDPTTGLPYRWYVFVGGSWVALHPFPVGFVGMYEGSLASIDTYDGGEAGTVTATTGPMWERVTQLDARFPMGPGTLPSGAAVAVTNTGGEEKHTLVEAELPKIEIQSRQRTDLVDGGGSAALLDHATFGTQVTVDEFGGDASGNTVAHNNLPPFYSLFFIRRTARLYYRI